MSELESKAMGEVTIYEPDSRKKVSFFKTWAIFFRNVLRFRELILEVFKRDFLAVYKKSLFGVGWVILSPLLGVISWVFMNATGILSPGDVGIPYPAYVLLGTSIWGLFMGFYSSAAETLAAGAGFILQVKYPHEVLLIKQTAQHLANFLLSFLLSVLVLLLFGVVPSWKILFFPALILPLFFLGAGIGLIISVIKVVALDFQKGFDLFLGLVIFITPIIYSQDVNSELLRRIVRWNPLTYLIGGARDLIIYGRMDHWTGFIFSAALSLAVFIFAGHFFFISEQKVIERMI